MALKRMKCHPNNFEMIPLPKKIAKIAQRLGLCPQATFAFFPLTLVPSPIAMPLI